MSRPPEILALQHGRQPDQREEASRQHALKAFILRSNFRRRCLRVLQQAGPPDAWLCAGFVRNAVFAVTCAVHSDALDADLDVVYLDARDLRRERDRAYEQTLQAHLPAAWSVKNQVRMAQRNGDAPYRDITDALAHFPETATAVAVRLGARGLEVAAPYGLADLEAGVIRLSPLGKPQIFAARCAEKRWAQRFPGVRVVHEGGDVH
ncbi:MAG: hypothetical protein RL701_7547 [Pseudomonadota bacterium]